eukprot:TRINITY_DN1491_c0_g1_i1.p1 TRINITY_DN1491_c0_g1~~TRINITY_DN1491_c0_g1_i1.p1  ORF type:complete len:110 (-),score=33.99 TRINITY_DN1491_c0_g1_i1:171-500(-)
MAASGSGRAAQLLALVGKELRHRTADRYPLAFPMRALSEEFESCEGGDDLTLLQTYHELLKSVREQSDLFDQYCIGTHQDQKVRIQKSAARVGLALPKAADSDDEGQQQ